MRVRAVDNQMYVAMCSPARNPDVAYQAVSLSGLSRVPVPVLAPVLGAGSRIGMHADGTVRTLDGRGSSVCSHLSRCPCRRKTDIVSGNILDEADEHEATIYADIGELGWSEKVAGMS
jgi:predicted amidohydrolase